MIGTPMRDQFIEPTVFDIATLVAQCTVRSVKTRVAGRAAVAVFFRPLARLRQGHPQDLLAA